MRAYEFLFEISDKIKQTLRAKFKQQNDLLSDDQINYYLDKWDRYAKNFPVDKRDITRLSFDEIEQLIDNAVSRAQLKGRGQQKTKQPEESKAIYKDNNLIINQGNTKERCIKYGDGFSFCISRNDSSNLFFSYRMRANEPVFYFVRDLQREKENPNDIWRFIVIQVDKNNNYTVTTADNPGDKPMTWETIIQHQPKLTNLRHLFKSQPLTPEERADLEKYKLPRNLENYNNMDLGEKYKYLQFGHKLTPEQQTITPRKLLEFYATNQSPNDITDETYKTISNSAKRIIIRNKFILRNSLQDLTPDDLLKYYSTINPFYLSPNTIEKIGHVTPKPGEYNFYNNTFIFTENSELKSKGDVIIVDDNQEVILPPNLTIQGNLNCDWSNIYSLPDNLTVQGWASFDHCPLTSIPKDIKIGTDLYLNITSLSSLPDNLTIPGTLDISETYISQLPRNLHVHNLKMVGLESDSWEITTMIIPKDLIVTGTLILSDRKTIIPKNNKINRIEYKDLFT